MTKVAIEEAVIMRSRSVAFDSAAATVDADDAMSQRPRP